MGIAAIDDDLARDSYYAATAPKPPTFLPLAGDCDCDVAIVGGGLAGLSAALELAERGFDVRLLEAREVGAGASGRNGGQAIFGLACEQDVVEAQLGLDDARRAWAMSIEALDLIQERMARHAIAAEWRPGWLAVATTPGKARDLDEWADHLEAVYGYPLKRVPAPELPQHVASPRYHGGALDPRSGHLHPLKYTYGIARAAAAAGAKLHERTAVTAIQPGARVQLATPRGSVRARMVLLAGNVYLNGLAPAIAPRIMPVGTYIACSEVLGPERIESLLPGRAAVCDTNFVLDYFRPTDDHRLLYGGRVSYSTLTPRDLGESMRRRMVHTFPQLEGVKVDYSWGGFVDISMNRAPDFGRLPEAPNIYYLQGFSGHGLALTGLAGKLVAEAAAGDASRFDVFARIHHHAFPGGRWLRTPALVLGMAWYRLRDLLG